MSTEKVIIQKMHQVIMGADQFKEEQFRMILEGLIKRGGKDAEFLLIRYISNKDVSQPTRANLIRITGYIRNVMYLMPLKKIIDAEPDIKLKKAAILALSKYNDERALNILNTVLQSISNPIIMKTIHEKINLIRQNHPVLALTPRFLKGNKDMKAHLVALGILKKILKTSDASSFLKYIDSDDPLIQKGTFELLCEVGSETMGPAIYKHFNSRLESCPCINEPKCDELFLLAVSLKKHFNRFPALVEAQIPMLQSTFSFVIDDRVKKTALGILCNCHSREILTFLKELYQKEIGMRECIIEETSGNPQAVDFLFEQYNSGKSLKEKVIKSLLKSDRGFGYFIEHFFTFELEHQEMIVRNLPTDARPELIKLIETLLGSDLLSLKKYVLNTIKNGHLYSFKDLLMDPNLDDQYFSMEDEYLSCIFALFPISATKKLITRFAKGKLALPTAKKYVTFMREACRYEIMVKFNTQEDGKILIDLMNVVFNLNNMELTNYFLGTIAHYNAMDMATYRHLGESLNYFVNKKTEDENATELTEEDKMEIRKMRENLKAVFAEVRKIEVIEKDVRMALMKSVPDLLMLKRLIESNGLALPFKAKPLMNLIMEHFKADEKSIAKWRGFFKGFPYLTKILREERLKADQTDIKNSDKSASLHDRLRVVLRFEDDQITSLFLDQLAGVIPHIKVAVNDLHLEDTDILLCDSAALKNYIDKKILGTRRIFVMLKQKEEYNLFKDLNPRSFQEPISLFRIFKQLLHDLYLPRPDQ
ncbi:MAG: hypothetical protein GY765_24300 [bacterium]|nr:hypothetical protein [bacterium]